MATRIPFVLVVIARWSGDLFVSFITFGIVCTVVDYKQIG